jgi:two-component system, OmpR family, sensor histidine kinase SenX3
MRLRVRPSGMLVLAAVLAVLLGALAVLQYRWVGQLSADERDRIKDHLKDSADEFAEDFNRELTRAFFWLQVGPVIRQEDTPEPDQQRYERWYSTAENPELIAAIYQVDLDPVPTGDGGHDLKLRQFVRNDPRLEDAPWPAVLEPVKQALIDRHGPAAPPQAPTAGSIAAWAPSGSGQRGTPESGRPMAVGLGRVPLLWPDLPAMVMPRARVVSTPPPPPNRPGQAMSGLPPLPAGYVIALLNPEYLKRQLIPRLVERHFVKGPDGALLVAIKGGQGVVFATDGAVPQALDHADVTESLWELRFHEFSRFVQDRRSPGGTTTVQSSVAPPPPPPPPAPDGSRGGGPPIIEHRIIERGRPASPSAPANTNYMVMYRAEDRSRSGPRTMVSGEIWKVHLLHGAGSLDAAVARSQARNLLISFGVLLLLGTSMTLVLISSARAERLAAQQMEFVAGVSHELRTPLAVIRSAAENLADGIVDDTQQVKRYGQLIAGEGRRLTQMVEQVMTFAGLEAGRPGFELRPIEIAPVVDDALNAVAPIVREHDAEISVEIAQVLPRVMADPSAVGRALQNLLQNALKYGGEPPRISVIVRPADAQREDRDAKAASAGASSLMFVDKRGLGSRPAEVEIVVEDHGPGITPRDLPHIFEPFYRGADVVARQIHGSGLGLSLVQRIVRAHGGRTAVTSEVGRGSRFALYIPIAPEAEVAAAHPAGAPLPVDR